MPVEGMASILFKKDDHCNADERYKQSYPVGPDSFFIFGDYCEQQTKKRDGINNKT